MACILPRYRLSEDEYKELWDNCIFVLDTSVLFNIYRYSPRLREEVIDILSKISDKLWLPYQVALEYYDNRSSVISIELNKYNSIKNIVSKIQKPSRGEIDEDLRRKHTTASEILSALENDLGVLENEFDKCLKKVKENLEENIKKCPKRKDLEGINEIISLLFNGKVGDPYPIEKLLRICEEGLRRYEQMLPPGYEDGKDPNKKRN